MLPPSCKPRYISSVVCHPNPIHGYLVQKPAGLDSLACFQTYATKFLLAASAEEPVGKVVSSKDLML